MSPTQSKTPSKKTREGIANALLGWVGFDIFVRYQKRAPLKSCHLARIEVLKKNFGKILKTQLATRNYMVITCNYQ